MIRPPFLTHVDGATTLADKILRHDLVLDHVGLFQRRPVRAKKDEKKGGRGGEGGKEKCETTKKKKKR